MWFYLLHDWVVTKHFYRHIEKQRCRIALTRMLFFWNKSNHCRLKTSLRGFAFFYNGEKRAFLPASVNDIQRYLSKWSLILAVGEARDIDRNHENIISQWEVLYFKIWFFQLDWWKIFQFLLDFFAEFFPS